MAEQKNPYDDFEESAVSVGGNYLAGVNERIDKILRFIPDKVVRQGLIAAGVPLDPEGKPTAFGHAAKMIEADTSLEKGARRAGNLTADAVPMIAGANIAAGNAALKTGGEFVKYAKNPSVMNALRSTADDAIRLIQKSPGKAATFEGGLAAMSGAGGGAASVASDGDPYAEAAGMVVGGLAPVALQNSTVGLALRGGRFIKSNLSKEALEQHAQGVVNKNIRGELTVEAQENIKQAGKAKARMAEDGVDFNPTLAEQSDSQGLIRSQMDIEQSLSGSELDAFVKRKRGDRIAIEKFTDSAAPDSESIPEYVIDSVVESVNKDASKLKASQSEIGAQKRKLGSSIKGTDRHDQGSKVRDRLLQLRSDKRQELNEVAESLGINGQDISEKYNDWAPSVIEELSPKSMFSDKKNVPEVVVDIQNAANETVTFKDIKALRERVSDDLIDAMTGDNPSRAKVRSLTVLKERVDELLGEIPDTIVDQSKKEAYEGFRKRYFSEYIERFEKGAAFDVRRKDGRGFFMTEEEKIGNAFFEKGGISAARQYKATFGDDQEAMAAMNAIVMDKFREDVVREGVVDAQLYKNFMREYDSVLREFPNIKNQFKDVGKSLEGLLTRQSQLKAREAFLETRALTKAIRSFEKGGQSPEGILRGILNNNKRYDDFMSRVKGDDRAFMGFKRWVWDQAVDEKNTEKFIVQNEDFLKDVLGDKHLEDIKTVLTARQIYARTPEPQGQAIEQDVFKNIQEKTGLGVTQYISRVMAVSRGRSSKWVEGGGSFVNLWGSRSTKQQRALMREILYEPQIADILAGSLTTTKFPKERLQKLNAWMFNAGMRPYIEDEAAPPNTQSDNPYDKF